MDHPVQLANLSPAAAKAADPAAPKPLKMMAASGLAPMGPQDLLRLLYLFSYDGDAALAAKAKETLAKLPDAVCGALEHISEPAVLDGLSPILSGRDAAAELILLNRATADETVVALAGKLRSERLLEVLFANEERLLRCPKIIEALYMNPAARMSSVDRAVELAVRNGLELEGIPAFAELKAALLGAQGQTPPSPQEPPPANCEAKDREYVDFDLAALLGDDVFCRLDEATLDDILNAIDRGESTLPEKAEAHTHVAKAAVSFTGMTISQKIRVATLGNANQRAILIRDSNKLVVMAVLKSPGVGDSEVVRFSKARSLPEEAIRHISRNRDWTKLYQVKLNLVNNPRTPLQDALQFLTHLRPTDVRIVENSRDVPRAVAMAAKQLRVKRGA